MKKTLLTLTLALFAASAAACTAEDNMTTATNTPIATVTPSATALLPQATDMMPGALIEGVDDMMDGPDGTSSPDAAGVTTMDKARRAVEQIEDELERLSEVDDAQVVIAGNRAAVALEFDDQYQGGIDDRLRGIIKERIDSIISGISSIAITSDAAIMDSLEALGDKLDTLSDMTALEKDLDAIIRKIDGEAA